MNGAAGRWADRVGGFAWDRITSQVSEFGAR